MSDPQVFNPQKNPKLVSIKTDRARKRKNFLPTVAIALIIWTMWGVIFFLVPPESFLTPVLFLALTFFGILFIASLAWANTRRGLLTAIGIIFFMISRYYGIGNYLTLVLITGILIAFEYYLSTH